MKVLDFGIWLLALIIFGLAFMVELERFKFLRRDEFQLVFGLIVVSVILFVDPIAGLLLGLALLVIFYRTHEALLGRSENSGWAGSYRDNDMMVTLEDYVTPSHLERAQNNTIDANTNSKMIGIKDPYGGAVYDTQGTYLGMPGTDSTQTQYAPIVS